MNGDHFKDELFQRLQNPIPWVTDLIYPNFIQELQKKSLLPEQDDPTALTLVHYQKTIFEKFNLQTIQNLKASPDLNLTAPEKVTLAKNLSRGEFRACTNSDTTKNKALFLETMKFLKNNNPRFALEVEMVIRHFFKVDSQIKFAAASHPHIWGTVVLSDYFFSLPVEERALSLIHEAAHQELFLLNLIDRLVTRESDFHLVHAPFQAKDRPPIARLHAAHVLYRMSQYKQLNNEDATQELDYLTQTVQSFEATELTPFAQKMLIQNYKAFCHSKEPKS
jgi:hypothetical protein